jgi:alkylation response protein AidB-like acyl-CoA dehydrogenase
LDLTFSPEQELLRTTVRDVLEKECPLSVVRQMEDDPVGYPADLWRTLGQLDLIGLLLPEAHGGAGMSLIEGVALYEELGRALAPLPHFVSAVLCGGALVEAGTEAQRAEWLPAIASGERIFSVAWLEPESGFSPLGVQARANGGRLHGVKRHVAFAAAADRLVVLARTGGGADEVDLFLVDPKGPGVALTQQFSLASDTQYEVVLDGAPAERLGQGPEGAGWAAFDRVLQDAVVLAAAQAVGGARYALDITVQYAKDRRQFDKPLGAFQALAHYLADAATSVDGAETLVHEAAWARAAGKPTDRLAPMAKLFACKTFRDLTATAQQIFGGIGFTLEFDIQLYFRRAKQLQLSWWDDRALEERVAAAVLA